MSLTGANVTDPTQVDPPPTGPAPWAARAHGRLLSACLVTLNILLILLFYFYFWRIFWKKPTSPNPTEPNPGATSTSSSRAPLPPPPEPPTTAASASPTPKSSPGCPCSCTRRRLRLTRPSAPCAWPSSETGIGAGFCPDVATDSTSSASTCGPNSTPRAPCVAPRSSPTPTSSPTRPCELGLISRLAR
uniref:Uncharacterized protein n=1 Tax=Ananas comosus var. bracteatus TaxID=296719 RepID=A0A6V7PD14_ANACO|nr:unnamed protein product [Ananas comosus var. bracteatus]